MVIKCNHILISLLRTGAATPAEVVELASAAMRAAGLSARDVTWLTEPPAKEITTEAGIKLASKSVSEQVRTWPAKELASLPVLIAWLAD